MGQRKIKTEHFDILLKGFRKVILATNIAESTITIPDVAYVIDFCLTKITRENNNSTYENLEMRWAAKSNCEQRKGRVGQVFKGTVFRMITED
jgi:ATP-dependent RNA helicase TDRD9